MSKCCGARWIPATKRTPYRSCSKCGLWEPGQEPPADAVEAILAAWMKAYPDDVWLLCF